MDLPQSFHPGKARFPAWWPWASRGGARRGSTDPAGPGAFAASRLRPEIPEAAGFEALSPQRRPARATAPEASRAGTPPASSEPALSAQEVVPLQPGSGGPLSLEVQPGGAALPMNRIVVQWSPTSTAVQRLVALQAIGGRVLSAIHSPLMQARGQGIVEVIELPPGLSLRQAIESYGRRPGVELAEHDWVVGIQAVADDPFYTTSGRLWGMYSSDNPTATGGSGTTNAFGSQAEQAWARGATGSTRVVMGVIDEGIDYRHPDLYLNIWLNPGEIPLSFRGSLIDVDGDGQITFRDLNSGANSAYASDINGNGRIDAGDLLNDGRWENGLDDDGNGYSDDLIGWDFFNRDNDPYDGTGDDHGTHVAGTIGALGGNGVGVAGVNWTVQLMALKFLGPSGGYTSDAAAAVNYYADMTRRHDADISGSSGQAEYAGTSNSWGGGGYLSALHKAIITGGSVGNLFVAAAGNNAANNDTTTHYPSSYSTLTGASGTAPLTWDAVVAVASITNAGALSSFSNYGAISVDLGAPGSSINSTLPENSYGSYSGTSMATPHVSGAVALLAAAYPNATPEQLLDALYSGSTPTASLAGRTVTGGRLNVDASLQQLAATLGDGGGSGGGGGSGPGTPVYSLSSSASAVNEGSSVSFTLTTTNVAAGTSLVWKLSGSGISSGDLEGGVLQGNLTVGSNGEAGFSVTLAADQLSEGAETLQASLVADAASTTVLAAASTLVNDTSLTPVSDPPLSIWGSTGSDDLTGAKGGGSAADRVTGVTSGGTAAANLGRGQVDKVSGGAGGDTFLLADSRGSFYTDGNSRASGTGDYLWVVDFNAAEDRLQLRNGTQIWYRNVTINGTAFTEFYLGDGNSSFNGGDELIARLENTSLAPGSGASLLGTQPWISRV